MSDPDLVALVRAGGELTETALIELNERHFDAVRAFAAVCLNDHAAPDQLADTAWRRTLWPHEAGPDRAVRPHALTHVLEAAAGIANWDQRGALDARLAMWLDRHLAATPDRGVSGGDFGPIHHGSVTARAFCSLPANLQAVMWHHWVEHAGSASIARLLGSDSRGAREISLLISRAYRDFYHAYEQIHLDGMTDYCRPFHRMVMAYVEHKGGNTADVVPHLQQCAYCSRAVAELERMRVDFGELLAGALLPWGGQEYVASRRTARTSAAIAAPVLGRLDDLPRSPALPEAPPAPPRSRRAPEGAGRGAPRVAGPAGRKAVRYSVPARRLTQAIASLGVCSLAVVFTSAQGFGPRLPQLVGGPPAKEVPPDPAPSESSTDGPSGSATKSPSPSGSAGRASKAPEGDESAPAVRGAAVEWLFKSVKDGVAEDSSGNNRDGTLVGDPLPKPLEKSGAAFFGQQSVTSQGPVLDTDGSFSVSARVMLRNKDEYQTVASQDGAEISSFQLQYDPVEDRWEMRMHREDTLTSRADEAESDTAPRTGEWTALTGVWDAADEQIRLYVDGQLQDTVDRDKDRSREGDFAVGRARLGDQFIRGFEGNIQDVRAFPKALTSAEARRLASGQ
ncbi:LamG-like jellyroll fold domain-containing protein [Streptomyces ovatisporus]|uniref:LamG-like jellyroll fold domain-containing protein n=1 Tax=Streptomyces ovatisporus TaxID=1128682 RepID=A0ABV9A4B1_9ACTN